MGEIEITANKLIIQLGGLYQLAEYISKRALAWQNYQKILESKKLLFRFNRKWIACRNARESLYPLTQNINAFEREMSRIGDSLKKNNPRLWDAIVNFKAVYENLNPFLLNLFKILNGEKENAKVYIKTNSKELLAWADSLGDRDLASKIRSSLRLIMGDEIDELNNCIADLDRWVAFRFGNDLMFFNKRIITYLQGGNLGKAAKENFLGLVTYFKDYKILADVKKSNALKRLLTYHRLIDIFMKIQKILQEILETRSNRPSWEGFLVKGFSGEEFFGDGFYNNLTKGRNLIKIIREDFGYADITDSIADRLESIYKTGNQNPAYWLKNVEWLISNRIAHPTIQNFYIVMPVVKDLKLIFEKRKEDISIVEIESEIDNLHSIVQRNFGNKINIAKNLKAFESILLKEMELLIKETEEDKTRMKGLLFNKGIPVLDYADAIDGLIASREMDLHKKVVAFLKLKELELKTLRRMKTFNFSNDDPVYSVKLHSILLKNEKRMDNINNWVHLVKVSGLSALKDESREIGIFLEKGRRLMNSVYSIDGQLNMVKKEYVILSRNGKNVDITSPEYFDMRADIELEKIA